MQLELRRRLSHGLSANVNYQYAFEGGSQFDGFSFGRAWTDIPVTGNPRPPRDQVAGGLDAAVRPGPALRQQHGPVRERARGRLERHQRRSLPGDRREPRQRPARRHDV